MKRAAPAEHRERGKGRILLLAGVILIGLFAWRSAGGGGGDGPPSAAPGVAHGGTARSGGGLARAIAEARERGAWVPPPRLDGAATISGTVRDALTHHGVGGVEVVFRSSEGEETTTAAPDGRYSIDLPLGTYRAFVRDETVLSAEQADLVRLPGLPSADAAGAPDEALMPLVVATHDADGIDIAVVRGGVVRGKVVNREGNPVAGAVLRAQSGDLRPALGTDVAESDESGAFELRLPPGGYALEVSHPRYAGIADGQGGFRLAPGEILTLMYTLVSGCVITGRVVTASGAPAGDGAIELKWGERPVDFAPAGRIASDGTFRWTVSAEWPVVLRAWPWKSPPSEPRSFACREGARFDDVVFSIPNRSPDLDGVLVDASGAPVTGAFVDFAPLDEGGVAQQERTDAHGHWSVYELPPGRYLATSYVGGRGVASSVVSAPQTQLRLALGGTGRIEGTTPQLANGSFVLAMHSCVAETGAVRMPTARRIVSVRDHQFTVEDVPACELSYSAMWRGRAVQMSTEVPAGGTARVELSSIGIEKVVDEDQPEEGLRAVEPAEVGIGPDRGPE